MAFRYDVECMIRPSVRSMVAVLVAGSVLSGGCRTPQPDPKPGSDSAGKPDLSYPQKQFEDQAPPFVAVGSLDSVVLIHGNQSRPIGSGTVIAPDRVLSAARVDSGLTRDERGRLSIRIGGAVMIWNYEIGRPELVGIFCGYVATETITTEQTRIARLSTQVRESKKSGVAFMIHRLPAIIRNPEAASQSR